MAVSTGAMEIFSRAIPRVSAAIWGSVVVTPWPISVLADMMYREPFSFIFTRTEVVEGVPVSLLKQAMPLPQRFPSSSVQRSGRSFQPMLAAAVSRHSFTAMVCMISPVMPTSPFCSTFFSRSSRGSIPNFSAIRSICRS